MLASLLLSFVVLDIIKLRTVHYYSVTVVYIYSIMLHIMYNSCPDSPEMIVFVMLLPAIYFSYTSCCWI